MTRVLGEPMHHVGDAGVVFADFPHDGDPLYYGRAWCGWHDPTDHTSIHDAERLLLEHAATHQQAP